MKIPGKRIIINMAPAYIRKEGSSYDLPLAMGILAANEQLKTEKLSSYMLMGELSLDGSLLPIKGVLPIAINARESGFRGFILPKSNAAEAAVVDGLEVYGMNNIKEVIDFLNGESNIEPTEPEICKKHVNGDGLIDFDFADVKGQENVKRGLEIAAAGGHNVVMIGPPGSGKTMLAKRLPGILPNLSMNEALETTKIHSVAGNIVNSTSLIWQRPFRSPHHTISEVALVGGGAYPQPGEISLAHNGVLFLDELPEFKRSALEVMRQPLEDREITISRAKFVVNYPANIMLIASMNPCPCGYYNHPERECTCPPGAVQKYLSKISGPLLDRIDLHIEVVPVKFEKMAEERQAESSAIVRERVVKAREIQHERFKYMKGVYSNSQMTPAVMKRYCRINDDAKKLLKLAMDKTGLSARAYNRIIKVARTIADLDGMSEIETNHIAEAIQYRSLDREAWGV
jgi:magnesium chelatase family protein